MDAWTRGRAPVVVLAFDRPGLEPGSDQCDEYDVEAASIVL